MNIKPSVLSSVIATAGAVAASLIIATAAHAINPFDIEYPIAELGNCADQKACKAFCDKPANARACSNFAKGKGLLSKTEEKAAETVLSGKGPGGCKDQATCEAYCNDVAHIDECVAFAESNGLMEGKELQEAKKVQQVVKKGLKMPGSCTNKKQCEAYCNNSDHTEECFAFAKDAGFIDAAEAQQAEKFIPLMKRGETPGGCKGRDACEAYCQDEAHFGECTSFAEKAGFISPEEAARARKTGGKGPGGCRGRECEAFCQDPANQQACFNFAKDNDLLNEADLKRMEEGRQQVKRGIDQAPPEVRSCLEEALGADTVQQINSDQGQFFGGPEIGQKMRTCFESFRPQQGESVGPTGQSGQNNGSTFNGQQNQNSSQGFGGNFSGPGGCSTPEECRTYCSDPVHVDECKREPSQQRGFPGQVPPAQGRQGGGNSQQADFQRDGADFQKDGTGFQRDGADFQKDGMNFQKDGASFQPQFQEEFKKQYQQQTGQQAKPVMMPGDVKSRMAPSFEGKVSGGASSANPVDQLRNYNWGAGQKDAAGQQRPVPPTFPPMMGKGDQPGMMPQFGGEMRAGQEGGMMPPPMQGFSGDHAMPGSQQGGFQPMMPGSGDMKPMEGSMPNGQSWPSSGSMTPPPFNQIPPSGGNMPSFGGSGSMMPAPSSGGSFSPPPSSGSGTMPPSPGPSGSLAPNSLIGSVLDIINGL